MVKRRVNLAEAQGLNDLLDSEWKERSELSQFLPDLEGDVGTVDLVPVDSDHGLEKLSPVPHLLNHCMEGRTMKSFSTQCVQCIYYKLV